MGHGDSEKPTGDYSLGAHAAFLRDLLGSLDIGRTTVVGHSLGGGIAMQLTYQHPELCERVVLVSSGGLGREINAALRLLALPGAEFVLPLIAPSFVRERGDALFAWMREKGIRSPRMNEGWQAYSSLADPGSRRAFVRELRSVVDYRGQVVSASDRLHLAAAFPTLIVMGQSQSTHPGRARGGCPRRHPGQPPRDLRRGGALPARRVPRAVRGGRHRVHPVDEACEARRR